MREKISACVTAGNEEQKIRRCLQSLTWCDEIIVVDSFSTDRTVEICREYTGRVYQHAWLGYVGQKELIKQMARHPWVFFVDADEEVSAQGSTEDSDGSAGEQTGAVSDDTDAADSGETVQAQTADGGLTAETEAEPETEAGTKGPARPQRITQRSASRSSSAK